MEYPSKELAKRILSEVDFNNRFVGSKMRERSGPVKVTNYSFKELLELMQDRLPGVNIQYLEKWIRDVMTDEELANSIHSISDTEESYINQIGEIRKLMEERFEQCREVALARQTAGEEPS